MSLPSHPLIIPRVTNTLHIVMFASHRGVARFGGQLLVGERETETKMRACWRRQQAGEHGVRTLGPALRSASFSAVLASHAFGPRRLGVAGSVCSNEVSLGCSSSGVWTTRSWGGAFFEHSSGLVSFAGQVLGDNNGTFGLAESRQRTARLR